MSVAAAKQYVARTGAKGQSLVAITCGANMNFDRLRFVAERAEVGEQREALFAVTIPEARGSFKRFCELLGPRSVTEFNYRIADDKVAHIFVGVAISKPDEAAKLARTFTKAGVEPSKLQATVAVSVSPEPGTPLNNNNNKRQCQPRTWNALK